MILEDFYSERVKKFCELSGISIVNGNIPSNRIAEVKDFLIKDQAKQKEITRSREDQSIRPLIKNEINRLSGQIMLSPIEEYLWNALKLDGLTHLALWQFPIGPFKIDIAFPIARLAVECDGFEYHRENYEQLERDERRDKYLARKGWVTLRITGIEIRRNMPACIEKIRSFLP